MNNKHEPQYRIITISGKYAVGTSTLAENLQEVLGWKYVNVGAIQRKYDREHSINENQRGAMARSDDHERQIDEMTKKMLKEEKNLIYEAWLAGFMAQGIPGILKVLLICSDEAVRIDRVVNRDKIAVDEAKQYIKQREEENAVKWKKLYGNYDFWDSKYYDLVIDTFSSGQMETLGRVLDKLNSKQ